MREKSVQSIGTVLWPELELCEQINAVLCAVVQRPVAVARHPDTE